MGVEGVHQRCGRQDSNERNCCRKLSLQRNILNVAGSSVRRFAPLVTDRTYGVCAGLLMPQSRDARSEVGPTKLAEANDLFA